MTEKEEKELENIDKKIDTIEKQLSDLKARKKELTEKKEKTSKLVNKAMNQLASIATTLGLDPETYGLKPKEKITTIGKVTISDEPKKSMYVSVWDEKNQVWKPHSANSIGEVAWYFTTGCSSFRERFTSNELIACLQKYNIDYRKNFIITFKNGKKIRVLYDPEDEMQAEVETQETQKKPEADK